MRENNYDGDKDLMVKRCREEFENKPLDYITEKNFVEFLKTCNIDYSALKSYAVISEVKSVLEGMSGKKLNADDMPLDFINFKDAAARFVTYDEYMEKLSSFRSFLDKEKLSYRELVMLEMLWIGLSLEEIVNLKKQDVILSNIPGIYIIMCIVDDNKYVIENEDFFKDFKIYEKEVMLGGCAKNKKSPKGKISKSEYKYDQKSPYYICKTVIGRASNDDKRLKIPIRIINSSLEAYSAVTGREDAKILSPDINISRTLYDIYKNKENSKELIDKLSTGLGNRRFARTLYGRFIEKLVEVMYVKE